MGLEETVLNRRGPMGQPNEIDRSTRVQNEASPMLDADGVAAMIRCSTKHALRMADSGRMPPCIKLGKLRRWQRAVIEKWIADGCPTVRRRPK